MTEVLQGAFLFFMASIWYLLMLFCASYAALYFLRVKKFTRLQNWILSVSGAVVTGHGLVWLMDLSLYLIIMHFMGAVLSLWIYKFVIKDFIPSEDDHKTACKKND